jgi:hypothetical protein
MVCGFTWPPVSRWPQRGQGLLATLPPCCTYPSRTTGATISPILLISIGVKKVIGVSRWAVGYLGTDGRWPNATQRVNLVGDDF